jgi:hypothetical protein
MILQSRKPRGFSRQTIRTFGMLFLAAGIIGHIIIQNLFPAADLMAAVSNPEIMADSTTMGMAVVSILLILIEGCAIPVFCFLLVEGFQYSSNLKNYFLRVLGVAAIAELPYNFAISGKIIDLNTRNPVFGMVLCFIILFLYKRYEAKGFKNFLIKTMVTILGLVWANMLSITDGAACVIVVGALWLLRDKPTFRVLGSCAAMFLASAFSMYYLVAPVAFLMVHSYNGEPGEGNKYVNYLAYPVMLLAFGLAAYFLL